MPSQGASYFGTGAIQGECTFMDGDGLETKEIFYLRNGDEGSFANLDRVPLKSCLLRCSVSES